ncbi:MAG: hypothetical protein ACO1RT_14070 [Planctomycetaceae bacterium]
MNLDDFKQPWQNQQRELGGQVDHVITAVRSRMSWFDRVIWWRDLRESLAAVLVFVWFGSYVVWSDEWLARAGAILVMLACVAIVAVLNWARLTGRIAKPGLSLQDYCAAELGRVDRQIWLLRYVNWWYTGPIFLGVAVQLLGMAPPPQVLIFSLIMLLPLGVFIHWLNQRAVVTQLMPLRDELAAAMNTTDDQASDQDQASVQDQASHQDLPSAPKPDAKRLSRRKLVLVFVGWLALFTVGIYWGEQFDVDGSSPLASPFTDVRFQGSQVIVQYDGQMYQWLAIDEVDVEDLIWSAKWRFGIQWQKRVAEDLVDLLLRMGHRPGDTVKLRLRELDTGREVIVERAPMTIENRYKVYEKRT